MSNNTPKLSFVVPIYGVERYIAKCTESLLGQSRTEGVEFVFVNDGTTDSSMEVLAELIDSRFSHLRPQIKVVNQANGGLPQARKTGVEHASGDYILFADSDDWLEPDAAEKILNTIERTDADLVYFDLVKEYADHQSIKRERHYTAESKESYIINIFNYRSHGYSVTKCFRRSLYTDNTIYTPPLGMHEDIYLMSQIIHYARTIVHLPEVLYHYRKDNEGAMCADARPRRHLASSRNLLDLYSHYMGSLAGSPIEKVAGGIVLRAGWHSLIHRANLFEEFPWLAAEISHTRPSCRFRTPLPFQLIVKAYSRVKKRTKS